MESSRIILAGSEEASDLARGDTSAAMSRRQQKQLERHLAHAVTVGQLPNLVVQIVDPAIKHTLQEVQRTDLTLGVLVELLIDKGYFTQEEADMKYDQVLQRLSERDRQKNNSPALAESEAAAAENGAQVQRLDEPLAEGETATRRLLEG